MLGVVLMVVALFGATNVALAEPRVSLEPAPDGTLILVGSGWRAGQQMVVSIGPDFFPALADAVGEFELPTGLVSTGGPPEPLAVHRTDAQTTPAAVARPLQPDTPHALAVLFAQALLSGAAFLGISAAGIGLMSLGVRFVHARRGA